MLLLGGCDHYSLHALVAVQQSHILCACAAWLQYVIGRPDDCILPEPFLAATLAGQLVLAVHIQHTPWQ